MDFGKPHTSDVNRDFPFVSAVRPSFRIYMYLSSISTIYNISSVTRMRIQCRGLRDDILAL